MNQHDPYEHKYESVIFQLSLALCIAFTYSYIELTWNDGYINTLICLISVICLSIWSYVGRVLVDSHKNGISLNSVLKENGIKYAIRNISQVYEALIFILYAVVKYNLV